MHAITVAKKRANLPHTIGMKYSHNRQIPDKNENRKSSAGFTWWCALKRKLGGDPNSDGVKMN